MTISSTSPSVTASTAATRSLTPYVLTDTPKRCSASTLSPSVTATLRMLSPKRTRRRLRSARAPVAADTHVRTRRVTSGSFTWPATVLRGTPSRVRTWANSRSPWAAWLRFMKSMSMVDHGSASLDWVCRCSNGLRSSSSPWIHIFAGENVCIQAITPTQRSSPLASRQARRIAAELVSTGFQTRRASSGRLGPSCSAMLRDCCSTWSSVSGPYRSWLPVRNQTCPEAAEASLGIVMVFEVGSVTVTVCSFAPALSPGRTRPGTGGRGHRRRPARSAPGCRAAGRCARCGRRPRTSPPPSPRRAPSSRS